MTSTFKSEDVTLLLNLVTNHQFITKDEKEARIAAGEHYSSFLISEDPPSREQLAEFNRLMNTYSYRISLGKWINGLADAIYEQAEDKDNIVLASLIRAGLPLGVLIKRSLELRYKVKVNHYALSIIRNFGLDEVAFNHIITNHGTNCALFFVDGWTGKGTIFNQLRESWKKIGHSLGMKPFRLVVLNDINHIANIYATDTDDIIPFGILNSVISGMLSRSVLSDEGKYHSCAIYENLKEYDVTNYFLDQITEVLDKFDSIPAKVNTYLKEQDDRRTNISIDHVMDTYDVEDELKIKPTISECTRALLRRKPRLVICSGDSGSIYNFMKSFADPLGIEIEIDSAILPYRAIAILR